MSPRQCKICSMPELFFSSSLKWGALCHEAVVPLLDTKGIAGVNLSLLPAANIMFHTWRTGHVCRKTEGIPNAKCLQVLHRIQASQLCSELPLLYSVLSVVFQFPGNIAKATHLSKTFTICSAPAAQWPEV